MSRTGLAPIEFKYAPTHCGPGEEEYLRGIEAEMRARGRDPELAVYRGYDGDFVTGDNGLVLPRPRSLFAMDAVAWRLYSQDGSLLNAAQYSCEHEIPVIEVYDSEQLTGAFDDEGVFVRDTMALAVKLRRQREAGDKYGFYDQVAHMDAQKSPADALIALVWPEL
jgi:hypothetical protein